MPDLIGTYRAAGFTEDEIADHMTAMRSQYQAAGFSDAEIDAHFGIPATPDKIPDPLLHRGVAGTEAVKTLNELPSDGAGVSGWLQRLWQRGQPRSVLEKGVAETEQEPATAAFEVAKAAGRGFVIGAGDKPIGSWTGPPDWNAPGWKKMSQAGLVLLGLPFEGAIRLGGGIAGAATGAAMEASKQATGAEYSPEDVSGFLNDYLPGLIGTHAELSRIERDPAGTPEVRRIGGLPKGQDFADASTAIGNGDAMPAVEDKLATLYRERGIHPAEVAHDAKDNPVVAQKMLSSDLTDVPYHDRPRPTDEQLKDNVRRWVSGLKGRADISLLPEAVERFGKPSSGGTFYRAEWPGRPDFSDVHSLSVSDRSTANDFAIMRNEGAFEDIAAGEGGEAAISEIKVPPGTRMLDVGDATGEKNTEAEQILPRGTFKLVGEREEPLKVGDGEGKYRIKTYEFRPNVNPEGGAAPEDILTERLPSSAGAAARAMPSYSDAEKQILSKISVDEKAPERAVTWDGLYTGFIDKLFPIAKAVKEADLPDLTAENNPYQLARLMTGYAGKADHFLNNGTFDFATYENNGPALKTILQPVAKDLNGFRAYAAAARAIELESRGIKSGFDFPEGPSAPPLVSSGLDAARTVVAEGREKFEQPFRALVDYQNRVAGYLRDSGVLSDAGHAAMVEANRMYVPFTRVMGLDEGGPSRGGSSLQARNPVKAIKGSARDIVDPIESVVRNTYHMIEMAERNLVGTKLVDMLRGAGEIAPDAKSAIEAAKAPADAARAGAIRDALGEVGIKKPDDLAAALASATEPEKPGTISILRDGKRETYNVDPELARAMKGLDAQAMSMLERMLSFPAKTLRAGAVLTPEFWGRHVLRDFLYAATTFKDGVFHPLDMAKGFLGLIMKDEDYWNWLKGGGGNIASAGIDRRYLQENLRELTGKTGLVGRAWNVLTDPEAAMWDKTSAVGKLPFQAISKFVLDPLRAGTQFAENASHLAAFKKSMRAADRREPDATNMRDRIIRAAWVSRDTAVDAARMGANMRAYNLITAFANIKLQDTDRVVRAIRDNPIPTLLKITGAITAPSVILWAANHNDPRYAEIPQWQKDMFWLIMTPDHVFRIPKPWAMGMTFGTVPERLLDAYVGEKPDAFKNFFTQLWKQVGPDFVPTAAAPIIDQFANRSTFTNRTLIPSQQEKFLPEYQYTPYTTELTKSLGRIIGAFPGIRDLKTDESGFGGAARAITSPILMENYLREWTGNLGSYALDAADAALRKQGILPDPPMPTKVLADIPIVRAFVVRYPSASAESIQDFYDAYSRNKTYFDTFMAKARDGDVQATQHIMDMGGPMMFLRLDGIQQALNEHNKLIGDVYKNPQIPPDEKRQLIDQAYFRMIEIAQAGNSVIRQMQGSVVEKNLPQ